MIYRRERPKCRNFISKACEDYGWSLQELLEFTRYDPEDVDWSPVFCFTSSLRIQVRKMLEESGGF